MRKTSQVERCQIGKHGNCKSKGETGDSEVAPSPALRRAIAHVEHDPFRQPIGLYSTAQGGESRLGTGYRRVKIGVYAQATTSLCREERHSVKIGYPGEGQECSNPLRGWQR